MEKLSDDDIHRILDHYGDSRLQVMNFQGLQDAVNFTDPLMATFQPIQPRAKETIETESNDDDDDPPQGSNSKDIMHDDSFGSPGFMQSNWHQLFDIEDYVSVLKEKALHGRLGHSPYRGICWKLFWECLPEERDQWIDATQKLRADYEQIRDKHLTDPYQSSGMDLEVNNPLSQAEDSPWHQYFQDGELRSTICQDVERLYPEMDFFRKNEIDDMILRCLFVYAKEHPNIVYKQGMHEIIAPIIYVLWENAQNIKDSKEDLQEIICIMNDQKYVEHDAYCIFREIMDSIEPMFVSKTVQNGEENNRQQKVADVDNLFVSSNAIQSTNAISKKLTRIQNYMLKRYDHELYSRLQDLDIVPQVYGIRWIRLLFGREYQLPSLLYLWDAMFADGRSLDLADFIFIAMLINIRNYLLKNDYSACLMQLMKYPSSTDVKMILRKALSLRSSKPNTLRPKHHMKAHTRKIMDRNESLRKNLSDTLTEQQKFAHALGSGRQKVATQTTKSAPKPSQWYADNVDNVEHQGAVTSGSGTKKEVFVQEIKRTPRSFTNLNDAKPTPSKQEPRKVDKSPRTPLMKSTVVSQISSAIGKHTSGLSSDVLSKFGSRNRNRPKEDLVSQLEEDHERLQKQICQLQTDYDRIQSLCLFCAGKMHSYLGFIDMHKEDAPSESELIKSCLNGLEKVRDILAKTTDIEPSTDTYERQFATIDKNLSEAFADKKKSMGNESENTLLLSANEDHFAETKSRGTGSSDVIDRIESQGTGFSDVIQGAFSEETGGDFVSEGENGQANAADVRRGSDDFGNKDDFDYLGYEPNDGQEGFSSNNSESNFSESKSSSSSATPEPWGYLKPAESPSDFEKELLSIKDRYETNLSAMEGRSDGSDTKLETMAFEENRGAAQTENEQAIESLDPLSAIEQHFNEM